MPHLTDAQLEQFRREGYLVVDDVIDVDTFIADMVQEYAEALEELVNELYAAGSISSRYEDLPFGKRLTRVYAETGKIHAQYFDFSLPFSGVLADTPCHFGQAVFNMLRCPGLLDVAESIIGPEISSNPVQHVRLKPPEQYTPRDPKTGKVMLGATEWHQDASVVLPEADDTEMLTVWVPINEATEANGCLCVVPRNHQVGLLRHCMTEQGTKPLPERFFDAERMLPLPMKPGSALFMNRMTPHCSLPNDSEDIRWSMDLRYNPTGQPTGRPEFPGFVARSRRDPSSELHDPLAWRDLWMQTRARMAANPELVGSFTRWKVGDPLCA
jgi:ectoine hydroxylase-related dioxygenase (phytanoyl-CoA dioxygenase family)